MADVLPNLYQVQQYLQGAGFVVSYKKLKAAVDRRELVARRGGGWSRRTADQYARTFLTREVDASPELDAPPLPGDDKPGAAERKTAGQAELVEIQAERARMKLDEERGRLTPTAVIESELGARARAFRLGLERFGHEQGEAVAGLFGGQQRQAQELAHRLGFEDKEAAQQATAVIVDFSLSRSESFPRFFAEKIDAFLDAYATDAWWTEDMAAAWERYQAAEGVEDADDDE